MNKVTVSAPGKLMLFGEHAVVYGNPCIVTAVDQRMRAIVARIEGGTIAVDAPDMNVKNYTVKVSELSKTEFPKEIKFVLTTVRNFYNKYKVESGLSIKTKTSFSSLFGFGSSSAITVCVAKALSEIYDIEVSNKELFDICYSTVLDVQGVGSGFDIASAIWGGTLYFVGGGKEILPLEIGELPLVVGYTGIKADTASLVRQVAELYKNDRNRVGKIFDLIKGIVLEAKTALTSANYSKLGSLMDENQRLLTDLKVNSIELGKLVNASRKNGAYGAKLSGAGGGDCMIALVSPEEKSRVESAIEKAGGSVLSVKTNAQGVRIERND